MSDDTTPEAKVRRRPPLNPEGPRVQRMELRVTPEESATWAAAALRRDISVAELVRRALVAYLRPR